MGGLGGRGERMREREKRRKGGVEEESVWSGRVEVEDGKERMS